MREDAHFHSRMPKEAIISDVAELIIAATGDMTDHLDSPSSICLTDLLNIQRAVESALGRNAARATTDA